MTELTDRQREYREVYLRSDHWRETRAAALERAEHRCQVCNSATQLDVHHRTYERLGKERSGDLTVLCRACHDTFHAHRKVQPTKPRRGMLSASSVRNIEQAMAGADPNHLWMLARDHLKANRWSTAREVAEGAFVDGAAHPNRMSRYTDWAYRVLAAAYDDGLVQRRNVPTESNRYGYNVEWACETKARRKQNKKAKAKKQPPSAKAARLGRENDELHGRQVEAASRQAAAREARKPRVTVETGA